MQITKRLLPAVRYGKAHMTLARALHGKLGHGTHFGVTTWERAGGKKVSESFRTREAQAHEHCYHGCHHDNKGAGRTSR
jgi:hypothetical protein